MVDRCAAAHIQEIGRISACDLDDVHGRHRQSGAIHHASDISIQANVIDAVSGSLDFERILLIEIAQRQQVFMPVNGIVVKIHFGIQRIEFVRLGQQEWIDLYQRSVDSLECAVKRRDDLCGRSSEAHRSDPA